MMCAIVVVSAAGIVVRKWIVPWLDELEFTSDT